jgi:MoaA/NifB/PqqE/SkfB family radical SAM enzyme
MEGGPERREQLPVAPILDAISECAALGIGRIYFTGGEPLLYPSLADVLRAAAAETSLGITVCTNGTIATPRHIALLSDTGARVHVSVDGRPPFHDSFRRRDRAFGDTERGVKAFVRAEIPVTIVSTISQSNLHELEFLASWSQERGVEHFRIQPLLDLGRGHDIADQRLTPAQLDRLLLQFSDIANAYAPLGLKCSLIGVTRKFLLAHPCGAYVCNGTGCHRRMAREIKKVVVREDGTVLPEVTNLSPRFAIGKLQDGSLRDQVMHYFDYGYHRFDHLCRTIYHKVVPTWPAAVVPWDQILAESSYEWRDDVPERLTTSGCSGSCGVTSQARHRNRELQVTETALPPDALPAGNLHGGTAPGVALGS